MKSILEIPAFAARDDLFDSLRKIDSKVSEKKYADFSFFEYDLDKDYSIYFYLLNQIPSYGNESLVDQVIVKAPFSIMFLDADETMAESKNGELFQNYLEKYSTPIFLLVVKDQQELFLNLTNDPVIKQSGSTILLFNSEDPKSIKAALLDAMKTLIPA
jgi:hypothetical protein